MVCSAWLAIDLAVSTSLFSEVMPVLAACRICTPLLMPSSRLLMSLARLSSHSGGEEVGGIVERRVHLLAGRKTALGGGEQVRSRLQR